MNLGKDEEQMASYVSPEILYAVTQMAKKGVPDGVISESLVYLGVALAEGQAASDKARLLKIVSWLRSVCEAIDVRLQH